MLLASYCSHLPGHSRLLPLSLGMPLDIFGQSHMPATLDYRIRTRNILRPLKTTEPRISGYSRSLLHNQDSQALLTWNQGPQGQPLLWQNKFPWTETLHRIKTLKAQKVCVRFILAGFHERCKKRNVRQAISYTSDANFHRHQKVRWNGITTLRQQGKKTGSLAKRVKFKGTRGRKMFMFKGPRTTLASETHSSSVRGRH